MPAKGNEMHGFPGFVQSDSRLHVQPLLLTEGDNHKNPKRRFSKE